MKLLRLLSFAAALLGFSSMANATGIIPTSSLFTPYVSLNAGMGFGQNFSGTNQYLLGAAVGVAPTFTLFGLGVRDEFAYDHFSISDGGTHLGTVSSQAVSNKAYLDTTFGAFHPYVGGGLGLVFLAGSGVQSGQTSLAGIVAGGVMLDLTSAIQVGAGYEHWTSLNSKLTSGANWQNNVLKGVVRINF